MSKRKWILSLAVNTFLVTSTLIISLSNLLTIRPADSYKMGFRGVENLMYYTVDSNIFMAFCAIGMIIFLLKNSRSCFRQQTCCDDSRIRSTPSLPEWFHIVIMAAAVSVGVTFATVAFFLSPGQAIIGRGYFSLFTGKNLYLHLINPLLGCMDFIWLIPPRIYLSVENRSGVNAASVCRRYTIAECLYGIIPTAIYGVIYTISVVFTKTWPDIYNFTFGGHNELAPVPLMTILAMSFGIAVLLTKLHNHAVSRRFTKTEITGGI